MLQLALLDGLACGSEVQVQGGTAGDGAAGEAGSGGCSPPFFACERFPEGDSVCADLQDGLISHSCGDIRDVSAGCIYSYGMSPPCQDCANWCCPPQPWGGPTYTELNPGSAGDAAPPPGCERRPEEDYMCAAQGKQPFAAYCQGLHGYEDAPCGPNGCCDENPYDTDCRPIAYAEGFCCPAF